MSTVASGGVNVPRLVNDERAGNRPTAANQRVPRGQIGIDTRERAQAMRGANLGLGPARHIARTISVLQRLLHEQAILHQRTAGFEPRRKGRETDDAERLAAFGPERRLEIVEPRLPLVFGAAGPNEHQARREPAELDGIRIRQHRHRIDGIVRQRDL